MILLKVVFPEYLLPIIQKIKGYKFCLIILFISGIDLLVSISLMTE